MLHSTFRNDLVSVGQHHASSVVTPALAASQAKTSASAARPQAFRIFPCISWGHGINPGMLKTNPEVNIFNSLKHVPRLADDVGFCLASCCYKHNSKNSNLPSCRTLPLCILLPKQGSWLPLWMCRIGRPRNMRRHHYMRWHRPVAQGCGGRVGPRKTWFFYCSAEALPWPLWPENTGTGPRQA